MSCIIFHDSCGRYPLQSTSMTCSSLGSDYKRRSDQAYPLQCLAPITFVWRGLLPGAQISYHHFMSLQFVRFHISVQYSIKLVLRPWVPPGDGDREPHYQQEILFAISQNYQDTRQNAVFQFYSIKGGSYHVGFSL